MTKVRLILIAAAALSFGAAAHAQATPEPAAAPAAPAPEAAKIDIDSLMKYDADVRASDGKVVGKFREAIDDDFVMHNGKTSLILSRKVLKADEKGLILTMTASEFERK
jgi:hypothetical protein